MKDIMNKIKRVIRFVTEDIWRITDDELTKVPHMVISILKTINLSLRRFNEDNLPIKSAALTFNTILSIVPLLALLFAIVRGFGFANLLETELFKTIPIERETLEQALIFVDRYLEQSKGGVFIGVGLAFLLWTVWGLISNIEEIFNEIWQVKQPRSLGRRFTDYFSFLFAVPFLMIFSSGISIFIPTLFDSYANHHLISPIVEFLIKSTPLFITWILFTLIYIFIPNTQVRFANAMASGLIAGTAFHLFQMLYINGQIWVAKYNAIYGSFAALPLLLLWIQASWLICLFGAELTFAIQNNMNFEFEKESKGVSRRYYDFLMLVICSLIVKRFAKGESPYSAPELSEECKIPIRLTRRILYQLLEAGVILEVSIDEGREAHFNPAIDINQISVAYLFNKINLMGSEDFKVDTKVKFNSQWNTLISLNKDVLRKSEDILLQNL
ncbi:YihY/virulence factor BrkB family protein [Porphyromonadaceae bacterium]